MVLTLCSYDILDQFADVKLQINYTHAGWGKFWSWTLPISLVHRISAVLRSWYGRMVSLWDIIRKRVVGAPKPACQRVFPLHLDVSLQRLRIGPQFQFYIAAMRVLQTCIINQKWYIRPCNSYSTWPIFKISIHGYRGHLLHDAQFRDIRWHREESKTRLQGLGHLQTEARPPTPVIVSKPLPPVS